MIPVSYTHLDVYKRQEQRGRRFQYDVEKGKYYTDFDCVPKLLLINERLYEEYGYYETVSYTHLDVYKRQGMDYGEEQIRKELDFLESRLRHMTRKEQDVFSVVLR